MCVCICVSLPTCQPCCHSGLKLLFILFVFLLSSQARENSAADWDLPQASGMNFIVQQDNDSLKACGLISSCSNHIDDNKINDFTVVMANAWIR